MSKILIVTDTHFGMNNDSPEMRDYMKQCIDEVFFKTIKKYNIDTIIDLGDTFDRRKYINFKTLHWAQQTWFDRLKEDNITCHVIVGNHNTYYKNTNDINSAQLLLSQYDNIKTYSEYTEINVKGLDISIVPWINDENKEVTLDLIKASNCDVCMGHLELSGFEVLRNIPHKGNISCHSFSHFKKTFSGHFHLKQTDGIVDYLGTGYDLDFSDVVEKKGIHLFDTKTLETTFIETPYKLFIRHNYDPEKYDYENYDFTQLTGKYVKLIVDKDLDDVAVEAYHEFTDNIKSADPAKLNIVRNHNNIYKIDKEAADETKSVLTIMYEHIDGLSGVKNADKIKSKINEIYVEALHGNVVAENQ